MAIWISAICHCHRRCEYTAWWNWKIPVWASSPQLPRSGGDMSGFICSTSANQLTQSGETTGKLRPDSWRKGWWRWRWCWGGQQALLKLSGEGNTGWKYSWNPRNLWKLLSFLLHCSMKTKQHLNTNFQPLYRMLHLLDWENMSKYTPPPASSHMSQ